MRETEDTVMEIKIARVLDEKCGLAFPAEYYDGVSPEDFRQVYKAGIREVVGWIRDKQFVPSVHSGNSIGKGVGCVWKCYDGCLLCLWQAKLKEWE